MAICSCPLESGTFFKKGTSSTSNRLHSSGTPSPREIKVTNSKVSRLRRTKRKGKKKNIRKRLKRNRRRMPRN
jgi:hypothetical protein